MNSYDNDIQALIPLLNDLERKLSYQQNIQSPNSTRTKIEERLELLEDRINQFNQEQKSSATEIQRTVPFNNYTNQEVNLKRKKLNELTNRLRQSTDMFHNNISLREEPKRLANEDFNRSLPSFVPDLPVQRNHFSRYGKNEINNMNNRALNNVEETQLEDIQQRLKKLQTGFRKFEDISPHYEHPSEENFMSSIPSPAFLQELKRTQDEILKLQVEQEKLTQIRNEIRRKELAKTMTNETMEHASVMVECGTPQNTRYRPEAGFSGGDYIHDFNDRRHESPISNDSRTRTLSFNGQPEITRLEERLGSVEALLIKALNRIELQDIEINKLKHSSASKQLNANLVSSTPMARKGNKTNSFEVQFQQLVAKQTNPSFLSALLPLISIANSDNLQEKILNSLKEIVNGEEHGDEEYTQSEYDISETEDDFKLDEFLNMNLTEFVKKTVEPVMSSYLEVTPDYQPITKNEIEMMLRDILKNSGAGKLKTGLRERFEQSIRDPMLRFVGNSGSAARDKLFVEISEVLFNEIRFVRTIMEGGLFVPSLQQLEDDEDAPRHVSQLDDSKTRKDIPLSVAEIKALTCYGSGEDEESKHSEEETPKPEDNPRTEIEKQTSGSSSPVLVPKNGTDESPKPTIE